MGPDLGASSPAGGSRADRRAASDLSLGRASLLMASGTLVSRVLGLVRTAMLTAVFGISLAGDARYFANALPNYLYILLSAGVLNAILIPQITKAMAKPDGGQDFVNRLLTMALTLIGAVTLVATAASPLLVKAISGFTGSTEKLAVMFSYVVMPQIAFFGLYAVLGNVLNARDKFGAVMWTPALANVVQIAGLAYFLAQWGQQRDPAAWTPTMVWVVAGTGTLGIVVQALGLIEPLRRTGFRWRPRWGLAGLGAVSRMTLWTLIALTLQQAGGFFNTWVMNTVRTRPGNEAVAATAAQANAFQIFMLPHSLVTVSLLTAFFPALSRALQGLKIRESRRIVMRGLTMPAVFIIPMSVVMIVLAAPIVRVILPGLNARESADTAAIVAMMAVGTMGFGMTTWQQRYCFAREDGRMNLWLQVLCTAIQMVFALLGLFAVPGRETVLMIAAGQSIGNTAVAVVFVGIANRQLAGLPLTDAIRLWVRLLMVSAVAGVVAGGIAWLGRGWSGWAIEAVLLAVSGIAFCVVFILLARRLRIKEVDDMIDPIVRRVSGVLGRR